MRVCTGRSSCCWSSLRGGCGRGIGLEGGRRWEDDTQPADEATIRWTDDVMRGMELRDRMMRSLW